MTKQKTRAASTRRPQLLLAPGPRQYLDMKDLRRLLKSAISLHAIGDPREKLTKAMAGLSRMIDADSWVAAVIAARPGARSALPAFYLSGGPSRGTTVQEKPAGDSDGNRGIEQRVALPKGTTGRVRAVISEDARAIHTFLVHESKGKAKQAITRMSFHRSPRRRDFLERERRIAELFHSQTAWIIQEIQLIMHDAPPPTRFKEGRISGRRA